MPPRKLFDISPPRPKVKAQKEKPLLKLGTKKFRLKLAVLSRTKVIALGTVVFAVLLFFSLHVWLAHAKVNIWPVSREAVLQETISVEPGAGSSAAKKTIPGTVLEQEQSGTKLFSSTGKETQETKAQGTIRVFNNQAKTQILIAQTRFISEDGKLFRSTSRITIESGGFTDVAVVAAETGSDYNIGPSNFSLPGLLGSALYTLVYGKSSQDMAGGGRTQVSVVTKEDLRSAEEAFTKELLASAKDQLYKSSLAPTTIIDESLREEVIKASSSVEEGAPISQFHVTGKVKVRALAFSQNELEALAKEIVTIGMSKDEKLQEQTLSIIRKSATFASATQKALLELEIRAKVYQDIDREELKQLLLQRSKAEAQQFLLDYPQIEKFEFSFFPFWKQEIGDLTNFGLFVII